MNSTYGWYWYCSPVEFPIMIFLSLHIQIFKFELNFPLWPLTKLFPWDTVIYVQPLPQSNKNIPGHGCFYLPALRLEWNSQKVTLPLPKQNYSSPYQTSYRLSTSSQPLDTFRCASYCNTALVLHRASPEQASNFLNHYLCRNCTDQFAF